MYYCVALSLHTHSRNSFYSAERSDIEYNVSLIFKINNCAISIMLLKSAVNFSAT